jgi:hypothetical protein
MPRAGRRSLSPAGRVVLVGVVADLLVSACCLEADMPAALGDDDPVAETQAGDRPAMLQLPPGSASHRPPAPQDLVELRVAFRRRFRDVLGRGRSAAGANAAATTLLDAATGESDRNVKWLMLVEARQLAANAGNAEAVERSIVLATALYDFDAVEEEYRTLAGIPLRGLDEAKAAGLARVAERLSGRAEADGRTDLAASAQALAMRGWQRAGNLDAARKAATRLTSLEPGRVPGRR